MNFAFLIIIRLKQYLIILFLVYPFLSPAQETGCFYANSNNELELETNVDFSKCDAFFLGEFHGVYGISEIKLALVKYLNTKYGISDVFMEIDYSSAWLYNRYLQTGDTTLFTSPMLVYAMKQPNRDFWKNLYQFNKTTGRKITIHGMDFERLDFIKALKLLMPPGKEKPKDISAMLHFIDTLSVTDINNSPLELEKRWPALAGHFVGESLLYGSIKNDIKKNRSLYQQYYGENFKTVAQIMFNENTFGKFDQRNKTMYRNMKKEIKEQGIKKFITFNGLAHGDKSDPKTRSLCYRLAESKPFKNKLAVIATLCKNCYNWELIPRYRDVPYYAPPTYKKDTALLNSIFDHYSNPKCKYTLIPSLTTGNSKVENFSDYLILMRDQPEF